MESMQMIHDISGDEQPSGGKGLAASAGALAGLKVIDLTRVLGGPYCTMILSDHGADVIKVEPPQGDEVRDWGPPFKDQPDGTRDASYFIGVNRNKRAIALDLAKPKGREVLLRLLAGADVLVENFKPGGMEKWGLGYQDALAPRFPRLIHCRVSGFGAKGPLGGFPGYDAIVQAMTGLMSINGDRSTGPLRMATPIVDLATGLYAAIAVLMALYERARSGRGQFLDMTLHDCGLALLHPQAANWLLDGTRPIATGNPHPNLAPYEKYRTRTGEIFIAAGNDAQFRKLCDLLGVPELARDPMFISNSDRLRNRPALIEHFTAVLADMDGHALTSRLLAAGLPAGPVMFVDEALSSEQASVRGMLTELDGYRGVGTPIKFSRTPGGTRAAPPGFAQHTDEVMAEFGFAPEAIAALRKQGVLAGRRRG